MIAPLTAKRKVAALARSFIFAAMIEITQTLFT